MRHLQAPQVGAAVCAHLRAQYSWNLDVLMARVLARCASGVDGHVTMAVGAVEEVGWGEHADVFVAAMGAPASPPRAPARLVRLGRLVWWALSPECRG